MEKTPGKVLMEKSATNGHQSTNLEQKKVASPKVFAKEKDFEDISKVLR